MEWKVSAIKPSCAEVGKIAVFFKCDESNMETVRVYRDREEAATLIPAELDALRWSTRNIEHECEMLQAEFMKSPDISVLA